jgi:hypothetical protein
MLKSHDVLKNRSSNNLFAIYHHFPNLPPFPQFTTLCLFQGQVARKDLNPVRNMSITRLFVWQMAGCFNVSVIKTTENFERGGGKRRRRGIKRGKLDKLITGYTMVNKRLSKHKPDKIQRREQVEPLRFRG